MEPPAVRFRQVTRGKLALGVTFGAVSRHARGMHRAEHVLFLVVLLLAPGPAAGSDPLAEALGELELSESDLVTPRALERDYHLS